MPIFDIFSKRKRNAEQAGEPVLFRKDELPNPFRIQVIHIWNGTFGDPEQVDFKFHLSGRREEYWQDVHNTAAREMGVFTLSSGRQTAMRHCHEFLLSSPNVDDVLSLIELSFIKGRSNRYARLGNQPLDDAVEELNHRFREHAIGYQFQGGQIISVESQYLYTETVEPVISLLYDAQFEGPLREFMQAHEHYRKGDCTAAIANAQYAFESTMKAICDRRGWSYGTARATAKNLLDVLFNNHLIPTQMQSHFTALRATLESGLPTVRNQPGQGGHGQGSEVVDVPDYLAAYCLHLAATNIVLLIEAHNASK